MSARAWVVGPVSLLAAYVGLAAWIPPTTDELYYWCWSRELQASYFDHPPGTAYLVRASTELVGDSVLAIRLPACVTSVLVVCVLAHLMRPRRLLPWVVASPVLTFGAVITTPDTPLLLFWALYLVWLVALNRRVTDGRTLPLWLWAVGGAALGCAALGKYPAALLVPAGFVSLALSGRPWRDWIAGYVFHGGLAFVLALPVLVFNVEHDFEPFRFQLAHASAKGTGGPVSLGAFVGLQTVLVGFLPVVLFPWVAWNWRALAADPRLRACACLFAVPFSLFLVKACRGPVEGNWPLACYLGLWPVAAHWYESARGDARARWLAAAAFAVPAGCVVVLALHLLAPLPVIPPPRDRIGKQTEKLRLQRDMADAIRAQGDVPVYAPTYQLTAELRFLGVPANQLDGVSRPSHFTRTRHHLGDADRAIVVTEGALPADQTDGFGPPVPLGAYPFYVRGQPVSCFHVLLYTRASADVP